MIENADFVPPAEPWALFGAWYDLAAQHEPNDPNAMTLATLGADGVPAARVVLMKGYDAAGFTFFTNRRSHKGEQLAAHPKAGLCWHWKSLRRQVRADGLITQTSDAESDAYFATRARGSQIGAWASQQSQPLDSRATLEQRVKELERTYEGKPVPRPPHWGGYRLTPLMVEFWQNREHRLHDRFVYQRMTPDAPWRIERIYP